MWFTKPKYIKTINMRDFISLLLVAVYTIPQGDHMIMKKQ